VRLNYEEMYHRAAKRAEAAGARCIELEKLRDECQAAALKAQKERGDQWERAEKAEAERGEAERFLRGLEWALKQGPERRSATQLQLAGDRAWVFNEIIERLSQLNVANKKMAAIQATSDDRYMKYEKAEAEADRWYLLFQAEEDRRDKAEDLIDTWSVRAEAYRQSADAAGVALLRAEAEAAEQRARAEKYLAAMQDAVRAYDRLAKGGYGGDLAVVWAAIRALVEEARRG